MFHGLITRISILDIAYIYICIYIYFSWFKFNRHFPGFSWGTTGSVKERDPSAAALPPPALLGVSEGLPVSQ